jgi:ADP-ribose pyrophosphatase
MPLRPLPPQDGTRVDRHARLTERDWVGSDVPFRSGRLRVEKRGSWVRVVHDAQDSAVALLRDDRGRYAFVRQHRNVIGEETLELPRGGSEPGEDCVACALREGWEETGIRGERRNARLLGTILGNTSLAATRLGVVLVDVGRVAEDSLEPPHHWEVDRVEFFSHAEAMELVRRGDLRCSLSISALAMAAAHGHP